MGYDYLQSTGEWEDIKCLTKIPTLTVCSADNTTDLILRGLCYDHAEKTRFQIMGYKNGKPFFHGNYGHIIYSKEPGEVMRQFLSAKIICF